VPQLGLVVGVVARWHVGSQCTRRCGMIDRGKRQSWVGNDGGILRNRTRIGDRLVGRMSRDTW
jgi:hypothetical protein